MMMEHLRSARPLSMICFTGLLWSAAAFADVAGLTVPRSAGGTVRIALPAGAKHGDPAASVQVFVGTSEACCEGKSPIAGRYQTDGQTVVFEPAFDFVAGQAYTIRTKLGAGPVLTGFQIAHDSPAAAPEVTGIYPSGPYIPENTLRFYVHFSTPMTPHLSTEFIELVDSNGVADPSAFMTFKQELWNKDRTRLTLLMDPGRIKRGVAQNLALGPALIQGDSYSIVVKGGWPSAQGDQEAPRFTQNFTVSKALRTLPDIALWNIQSSAVSTRDPLVIRFDRPFDLSLAKRAITVLNESGHTIDGIVSVENHQRVWRFEPAAPWTGTSVRIVVDARLEDVAGNNFRELLDHATGTEVLDMDQTSISVQLGPAPE